MKNSILILGILFFSLMTIPSEAQIISIEENDSQEMTVDQMEQIEKPRKLKIVRERVDYGLIDPDTGERRNNSGNNSADTRTHITSPRSYYRNIAFEEIPIVIKGTSTRNSEIEGMISTTYKKYGHEVKKRMKLNFSSDNDGEWGAVKIFSIKVDEADGKVTHKLTAVRMEDNREIENTAAVTFYSNPTKKSSLMITSPSTAVRVNANIAIRGKAVPGTKVEVSVKVQGYNPGSSSNGWYMVKDWHTVTTNSNGYWKTSIIRFKSNDNIQQSKVHYSIDAKDEDDHQNSKEIIIKGY